MEKPSPSWVFPTVRVLVTLLFYFLLVVLVVFTLMSTLKFLSLQTGNFTIGAGNVTLGQNNAGSGQEPPNYVSVPVAWEPARVETSSALGKSPVYLRPEKQTGQLQVPIRSMPGLLIVALGLISLTTAVWTFFLLRRIFQTVTTESPFHVDNARRLQAMGLLFLGQTLIEGLLKVALWSQTRPYFQQIRSDYQHSLSVDVKLEGPFLLGLMLLALAQVYRRGIELQTETELTV